MTIHLFIQDSKKNTWLSCRLIIEPEVLICKKFVDTFGMDSVVPTFIEDFHIAILRFLYLFIKHSIPNAQCDRYGQNLYPNHILYGFLIKEIHFNFFL